MGILVTVKVQAANHKKALELAKTLRSTNAISIEEIYFAIEIVKKDSVMHSKLMTFISRNQIPIYPGVNLDLAEQSVRASCKLKI